MQGPRTFICGLGLTLIMVRRRSRLVRVPRVVPMCVFADNYRAALPGRQGSVCMDLQQSLPHSPRRAQLRDAGWRIMAKRTSISPPQPTATTHPALPCVYGNAFHRRYKTENRPAHRTIRTSQYARASFLTIHHGPHDARAACLLL